MPTAQSVECANAVVSFLNTGVYSQAMTAARAYIAEKSLENIRALQVNVVPDKRVSSIVARGYRNRDITLKIGVNKEVALQDLTTMDALALLAEEIDERLDGEILTGAEGTKFKWVSAQIEPIYDAEVLLTTGTFLTFLIVIFSAQKQVT